MAKRFNHLYEQVCDFGNLYKAFKKASKGKRGQPEVVAFELELEPNLIDIQDRLRAGTWRPGPYRSFHVAEPKARLISAAPFADRVVHHALVNIIEPLFEATFIGDSYANRKGKGTHAALDRAQVWMRHYPYALQCDIKQFFPSVDHELLLAVLARKLACQRTLALCGHILAGGAHLHANERVPGYAGDDLFSALRPRGLPLGNLTSQFWANVLLNEMDQFIKRELRVVPYLRYVDDFVLFGSSKPELWAAKAAIVQRLSGLRLSMHPRRSTVLRCEDGLPFLGLRLFPHHRRLKARNPRAFARRLRGWRAAVARGTMAWPQVSQRTAGWVAHAEGANTWRLRCALFGVWMPAAPAGKVARG
jgi:RNA-directed DNA polymerase